MKTRAVYLTLIAIVLTSNVNASQPESVSKEYRSLVPRQIMPLLHTPEIHLELKFSKAQIAELETLFSEIDSTWFQSRNLPDENQNDVRPWPPYCD